MQLRLKYQLYPGTSYFVTYHTDPDSQVVLNNATKQILHEQIKKISAKLNVAVPHFAILDNHFHLVAIPASNNLPKEFIAQIAGGSSFSINKLLDRSGKLWDKYYCWGIFHEEAYNNIASYILGNPLRHGIVKSFDELMEYPFCSFGQYASERDRAAMEEQVLSILKFKAKETEEDFYKSLIAYREPAKK